jgi:putative NADPH-quinone reductase
MKTTVLLFHPNLKASRVNRALIHALSNSIETRNMYELYPNFNVDSTKEKGILNNANRIVIQFPMYWYSSPALLKQWEDTVLEYGWAYGPKGTALQNKELIIAVSPGANNYERTGSAKYTITELLRPFQATARLVGMRYMKPFITTNASNISPKSLNRQAERYATYLASKYLQPLGTFE